MRPVHPTPPGPTQESVWDYPRPPRIERSGRRITVSLGGSTIADSVNAVRVLETSHPPGWYVPAADVSPGVLRRSAARPTVCEWKGVAAYWDVVDGDRTLVAAAWSYEQPTPSFADITGYLSFMPIELSCAVDGERVRAQDGGFYGGWITDDVVGPFKGGPGTSGW